MTYLHNGNIALVYNDTQRGRTPLTVALSTDEGETWEYKQHLETEAGEYSYPAIIQAHDGVIHITIPTDALASCTLKLTKYGFKNSVNC